MANEVSEKAGEQFIARSRCVSGGEQNRHHHHENLGVPLLHAYQPLPEFIQYLFVAAESEFCIGVYLQVLERFVERLQVIFHLLFLRLVMNVLELFNTRDE